MALLDMQAMEPTRGGDGGGGGGGCGCAGSDASLLLCDSLVSVLVC